MLLFAPLALASAAPDDEIAEEIIVYGDDFARWNDTRWLVQSELVLPLGVDFATDQNYAFTSFAFQLRAVIACSKDAKLSKKRWEVSCAIEDIGILATSFRDWRKEKNRERVQMVLDQIDGKLTGARIQMQVLSDGAVVNFDIEGIDASNERERVILETLRQVIKRLMAGFHLRIPDHAQRGGQFIEYNNTLMELPSLTASRGSTTMVHLVSPDKPQKGMQLVQTVGEGTIAIFLPAASSDPFKVVPDTSGAGVDLGGVSGGGIGGASGIEADAPADDFQMPSSKQGSESSIELTYAMKATGVALFEKDTGIMSERVWACHGWPTAGSAGGTVNTGPYRNVGRMQLLGAADKPDVGPTRQVAWPGRRMEGLDPWVDIEALPE